MAETRIAITREDLLDVLEKRHSPDPTPSREPSVLCLVPSRIVGRNLGEALALRGIPTEGYVETYTVEDLAGDALLHAGVDRRDVMSSPLRRELMRAVLANVESRANDNPLHWLATSFPWQGEDPLDSLDRLAVLDDEFDEYLRATDGGRYLVGEVEWPGRAYTHGEMWASFTEEEIAVFREEWERMDRG